MELTEALRTTGAIREFTDEPVTDEVVHLDRGRVVDVGTHAELMARDPQYVDLASSYARRSAEQDAEHGAAAADRGAR